MKSIVFTQGLSMVFMLAVPIAPTFAIAGGLFIVRSFMMNVSGPLGTSLIMGLVDKDERGAASGISAAIWRFPNSISTVIGSAMMREGMLALPFYIASVLYSLSIFLFWSFFRKVRVPEETGQPPNIPSPRSVLTLVGHSGLVLTAEPDARTGSSYCLS